MSFSSSSRLSLHHVSIAMIVMLEYLQTIMVAFASSYISGGIDAAPEEFSLAAACYAAVAVVMILSHRWLVQQFGYRTMLRLSLLSFGIGALMCGCANNVPEFIVGRMVQAVGGAAFFTASRVQILHYQGKARIPAMLAMPVGIIFGSGLAPVLAAFMVENYSWRGMFLIMVPLALLVDIVVARAVPEREPVENEQPDELHPRGVLMLAGGIFLLQFALERARFDLFSNGLHLWALGFFAVAILLGTLWHEWRRETPLISYREFTSERYVLGLSVYCFGYLIVSACNYILPVFMVQGLGIAVQNTGLLMGLSTLIGVPVAFGHLKLMMRWPYIKYYLLCGLGLLLIFGVMMERLSEDVPLATMVIPVMLLSGLFMPLVLGTAAAGTFRGVEEKVFTHAYQVKNAMREVANSMGLSWATIILQMRSNLHYHRLAESTGQMSPWYGGAGVGADPWGLLTNPSSSSLAQLGVALTRQSTLMACQDFFWGVGMVALLAAVLVAWQRRFI
ncbi:MFS transporter [Paludibacterium denitrificans]|uniref:MFS transporter n=1 Tax=Paludibacterium denitrificans TaxID=2675226 RepID=A0A844GF64_9NEIS|nr:MFS transporter [Paludibacterium denitrificans]MTD33175.1 MFS transporter [Paludibacterium denitrificans]